MAPWSTKNWLRFGFYVIIATALAVLRLSGIKNEILKSFVWYYDGCFCGVAIAGYWHNIVGWKWYAGLGVALGLVETVVSLMDPGGKVMP